MKNKKIRTQIIAVFAVLFVLFAVSSLITEWLTRSAMALLRDGGDIEEAAAILSRSSIWTAVFTGCTLVLSILLIVWLSGNISKPLGFLAGVISGIAETGNIFLDDAAYKETKVLNKRGDEIGKISRSVGDMLAMFRTKIQSLNAVANGDLTTDIKLRSQKDTIGTALAGMVASLNGMFCEIRTASSQVSDGSSKLADGARSLAEGSGEQAGAIARINATISDIAGQTAQNAGMAREAATLSDSIKRIAERGGAQMGEMISAVQKINEASDAISKVIKSIEDIAFQTSILALNASVEAARAGTHGKGFAVVAGEVRSLAAKSQAAAMESEALIIDSIERAKLGVQIAGETAASLREIVQGVNKNALLIGEIASSSDKQALAIAQVNETIEQVNRVVQDNSETAAYSADSSKEVSGQSEILQDLIARFKIRESLR